MNFTDNQFAIEKLLMLPDKVAGKKNKSAYFKGVYIFSRDYDDTSYKIGMAWGVGGLYQRLKNYKICYPYKNEFFLQYLLISATADDAKTLETKVLASKKLESVAENPTVEGRRSREWKMVSKREILNNVLKSSLSANLNLWTHCIVFGKTGWIIHTNNGQALPDLVRPSSSRATQHSLFEEPGAASRNDSEFYVAGTEQVGDTIATPWGAALVVKIHKNKDLELKWADLSGTYRVGLGP
jgi:hypothetical protein